MKHILMQSLSKVPGIYKKLIGGFMLTAVLVMPEEILDTLIELLHLGYEGISFILEELIQHVFHVSKYLSQSIVFYLWFSIALLVLYYSWCRLPDLLQQLEQFRQSIRLKLADYWLRQSWSRKLGIFAVCTAGVYFYFSFFL